VSVSAYLEICM